MWPYGQTPPLEKCEQPDLKHPQAMLQNDICPQNSPEGGRVSPPGPRTIVSVLDFQDVLSSLRIKILLLRRSKWEEIKPRNNQPLKRRHGTLQSNEKLFRVEILSI